MNSTAIENTHKKSEEEAVLKDLLPKGTCLLSEYRKFEYVQRFLQEVCFQKFILPLKIEYSKFVVVRKKVEGQKDIFKLYHDPKNHFLLSGQNQDNSIGVNYFLSTAEIPKKDQFYVGKVRGNFSGNEFNIYDDGDNPDKLKKKLRNQLGFIKFTDNSIWSSRDEKAITVIIPRPQQTFTESKGITKYLPLQFPCKNGENLLQKQLNAKRQPNQIQVLKKIQKKNKGSSSIYSLQNEDKVECLRIDKKSANLYQIYMGGPLTLLQGFGITLAYIEMKQN